MPAKTKAARASAAVLRGHTAKKPLTYRRGSVFVAMEYRDTPERSKTYQAIVRACEASRLDASRVDESAGPRHILLDVLRAMEDAEFLVFDLSRARPNVYYELGYAHGVGNRPDDILLVAQKGTKIHADILPFRVLYYTSSAQLEKQLRGQLPLLVHTARSRGSAQRRTARRRAALRCRGRT